MGKTKIEWATDVWNPVTGCSKVSEGCRNCYAKTFTKRFEGTPGHYFESGFQVTLRPEKLDQPLRWERPRQIFVNSMSDLFHSKVPFDYVDRVFAIMALTPHHTYQILTKRPALMNLYLTAPDRLETIGHMAMQLYEELGGRGDCNIPASLIHGPGRVTNLEGVPERPVGWPLPNVWLGVSVENQQTADERIPYLLNTPSAIRFLSCEPLLGHIDLKVVPGKFQINHSNNDGYGITALEGIDWIIVGGESGPRARPLHPKWAHDLLYQCLDSDIPFFFKQWGEWTPVHESRANEEGVKEKRWHRFDADTSVCRVGKKIAGRILDNKTWDEYPKTRGAGVLQKNH